MRVFASHCALGHLLQLAKLAVLPFVCLLEYLLHGRKHTVQQLLAVALVTAGVGVCTVTDVQLKREGFIVALVAVLATALQQVVSRTRCCTEHVLVYSNLPKSMNRKLS